MKTKSLERASMPMYVLAKTGCTIILLSIGAKLTHKPLHSPHMATPTNSTCQLQKSLTKN